MLLEPAEDIDIVGEAGSGDELLALIASVPVDVVLLDLRMPGMSGFEVLRELRRSRPEVAVLVITMYDTPSYLRRAVRLGASGYVLKSVGSEELIRAVRAVAEGGAYVPSDLTPRLVELAIGDRAFEVDETDEAIIRGIASGETDEEIAQELGINPARLRRRLHDLYRRLGVNSRAEAVAAAYRLGILV